MLDQNAVLDASDVRRNPVHGLAEARKAPMDDHKIFFGYDRSGFVLQRRRQALDKMEETFTARRDMSAVLDVVGRPIALGRGIVPLVEQRVEGLKDELFVLLFHRLIHLYPPSRRLRRTGETSWLFSFGPYSFPSDVYSELHGSFKNTHCGAYELCIRIHKTDDIFRRSIPILLIRVTKVVLFRPIRAAAPFGPPTRPLVSFRIRTILSRSSKLLTRAGIKFPPLGADSGAEMAKLPLHVRITARSTTF